MTEQQRIEWARAVIQADPEQDNIGTAAHIVLAEMNEEIRVGDMVEIAMYVCGERRPMGRGRVVRVRSGYCDVDHCYPYGAPWVYGETTSSLRKIESHRGKLKE